MRRAILGFFVLASIVVWACNQAGPTAPSVRGLMGIGTLPSIQKQSVATILDGTTWSAGDYWVTLYPNYPAEPPDPKYVQRVTQNQAPADPCTLRWPGYETNYSIDHDDDYLTPLWHWCQVDD